MNTQHYEDKAFQALAEAKRHLIEAENTFGDNDLVSIEHAAIKNIRTTLEHCQGMLNELQWTRVRARKQ